MKKKLLITIACLSLTSCHIKKKFAEDKTVEQRTTVNLSDSSKIKVRSKAAIIDSTKTITVDSTGNNTVVTEDIIIDYAHPLAGMPAKKTIHKERRNSQTNKTVSTQQNNVKSTDQKRLTNELVHKSRQTINFQLKDKVSSETTKSSLSIVWWVIAIISIAVVGYYLVKRFSIIGWMSDLFSKN